MNPRVDMNRGWPCKEQLELSMPLLDAVTSKDSLELENDYRSYAGTGGIEPAKKLFSEMLGVAEDEIYIGGSMSTSIMYDIINKAVHFGIGEKNISWNSDREIKFLCPSPGYEKHFMICQRFGIKMIPIPIYSDGPDMDMVEGLVKRDSSIKGIWCVPQYSNPTGSIYSNEVVKRLARMETKAPDFLILWDNAYCVHHLTDEPVKISNILEESKKAGKPDRVFIFASTSKITFPGGGIAFLAGSKNNIEWYTGSALLQLKTGDKINQLRHVRFLKSSEGIYEHMKKHRLIIKPKFDLIHSILTREVGDVVKWEKPKGGYFINLELPEHTAAQVYELCKKEGILLTPAGSTFPYGEDPEDKYIRLAPTHPSIEELELAMEVLCGAIKSL